MATTSAPATCSGADGGLVDVEDLHRLAVREMKKTYVDPNTGFQVFTKVAHLKRGRCCGNQCRHCPYGWSNVAGASASGRIATVPSGNETAVQDELARLQALAEDAPAASLPDPPRRVGGDGGRRGGRYTSKNVPYTRSGDKGTSQLFTGERRSKDHDIFEAMGTVDELCAIVGTLHAELLVASTTCPYGDLPEWLLDVMSRLFDVGSYIARPQRTTRRRRPRVEGKGDDHDDSSEEDDDDEQVAAEKKKSSQHDAKFEEEHIDALEDYIDIMTDQLPELTSFILPTGSTLSAQFHVARCVCRRAERRVVTLDSEGLDPSLHRYLNRLSDFLFVAARFTNYCQGRDEIQYRAPTRRTGVIRNRSCVTVPMASKPNSDDT